MNAPSVVEGRAIRRWHKDRVIELCPRGHYMRTVAEFGRGFAGSAAEVELGKSPPFVRCDGTDCRRIP